MPPKNRDLQYHFTGIVDKPHNLFGSKPPTSKHVLEAGTPI